MGSATRKTAVRRLKNQNLYDASEWIIGKRENATKFCSQRRLSPEVTKRLRFLSPSGEMKEPFFVSDTELDVQATRGVREITSGTAVLLEDIFELTDRHAGSVEPIVVGYDSLRMKIEARSEFDSILPNEVLQSERLLEGSVTEILVNRYERDAKARQQCLEIHGTACAVCFFDYAAKYGPEFAGFIHVHHLIPLSQIGREYRVDPLNDLVPICPNCHAAVHRRIPPFEIEELQRLMLDQIENRES